MIQDSSFFTIGRWSFLSPSKILFFYWNKYLKCQSTSKISFSPNKAKNTWAGVLFSKPLSNYLLL